MILNKINTDTLPNTCLCPEIDIVTPSVMLKYHYIYLRTNHLVEAEWFRVLNLKSSNSKFTYSSDHPLDLSQVVTGSTSLLCLDIWLTCLPLPANCDS